MPIDKMKAAVKSVFLAEGEGDTGCDNLNMIRTMAGDVGATDFDFEDGVCTLTVQGPENAAELIEALEDEDCVEAYDVTHDGESDVEDILELPEDTKFGFVIYLEEDEVTYTAETVDVDTLDESVGATGVKPYAFDYFGVATTLDEVKKKMKVNFRGQKRIKMQCAPGFKYNATTKSCEKIGGEALAKHRKASIRALVTRKAGGASLKKRAALRTKKAMNFRKAMGLK